MPTGRVKWYDFDKGYGFIEPDDGGDDVFVHVEHVRKAGYLSLVPGAHVSYEIRPGYGGRPGAQKLKIG